MNRFSLFLNFAFILLQFAACLGRSGSALAQMNDRFRAVAPLQAGVALANLHTHKISSMIDCIDSIYQISSGPKHYDPGAKTYVIPHVSAKGGVPFFYEFTKSDILERRLADDNDKAFNCFLVTKDHGDVFLLRAGYDFEIKKPVGKGCVGPLIKKQSKILSFSAVEELRNELLDRIKTISGKYAADANADSGTYLYALGAFGKCEGIDDAVKAELETESLKIRSAAAKRKAGLSGEQGNRGGASNSEGPPSGGTREIR